MGIELGIGEMLLVKAIAESTGRATTKIKEDLRREGDLGKVAMVCSPFPLSSTVLTESVVKKQSTYNVQAKTSNCAGSLQGSDRNRQS